MERHLLAWLVAIAMGLCAPVTHAQEGSAPNAEQPQENVDEGGDYRDEDEADEEERDPMDSGLSARAGVELMGVRNFGSVTRNALDQVTGLPVDPNQVITTQAPFRVDASEDFQVAAALNLGGFIYYRLEGALTLGTFDNVSVYNGLGFNLHFGNVYLGAGIGGRVGWLMHNQLEWGVGLAGRIPVDLTVYVAKDLALFLEGAANFTFDLVQLKGVQDISTATSGSFEISGGVRFP